MTQALSIRDLRKVYGTGTVALRHVSMDVADGEFFALLGPNGAGKSTVIGIVTSLVNKSAGTVEVFGHDIDHDFGAAKECLGVVPQEFNFNQFERVMQVLVNQAGYYGIRRGVALQRAERYLKQLGLWEKRDAVTRTLSGGQKRRLMIARALVHEPRLLILDEPTAGVDIEVRHGMWGFLRRINEEGTTVILTTHYLEEAENLCNRIAIIDHGEVVENTSKKELLRRLNLQTFILDLVTPVEQLPDLPDHELRLVDETTLEVDISGERSINKLFADLSKHDIRVASMRNKTNRLEQLFLGMLEHRNHQA